MLKLFRKWLCGKNQLSFKQRSKQGRVSLYLESLEDRLVPTPLPIAPPAVVPLWVFNNLDYSPGMAPIAGSLCAIIANAAPFSTIEFRPAVANQTISLLAPISISNSLTIDAESQNITIENKFANDRIFVIQAGANVNIDGLSFTKGFSANLGGGGAILSEGNLTLSNDKFTGNGVAPFGPLPLFGPGPVPPGFGGGGAVLALANLSLYSDTFSENYVNNVNLAGAGPGGGAIDAEGGPTNTLTVNGCDFENNQAINGFGGAIAIHGPAATIVNTRFTANKSDKGGGAIADGSDSLSAPLFIRGSSFLSNTALFNLQLASGGAVFAKNENVQIENSQFINNKAQDGGAVYYEPANWLGQINAAADFSLNNDQFFGNSATSSGGGICMMFSTMPWLCLLAMSWDVAFLAIMVETVRL